MGNCISSILSVLFSSPNDSRIKREYVAVSSSTLTEKSNSYLEFVSSIHDQNSVTVSKPNSYNSINENDIPSSSVSANNSRNYSSQNDVSYSGPSTALHNSNEYQHPMPGGALQGFHSSDNRVNINVSQPVTATGLITTGYNATTNMNIPAPSFSKQKQSSVSQFSTKYDLRDEIGVGSTSKCYKCIRKFDGKEFACKVIDKRNVEMKFSGLLDQFFVEIKVLRTLNHPNIIRLEDTFETPDRIFMVMEMMKGGELFDYVVEKGTLSEEEASVLVRKITSAVAHMHNLNIIHRDLKPENLLLTTKANNNSNINTINNPGKLLNSVDAEVSFSSSSCALTVMSLPIFIVGETDRFWPGQGDG